MTLQSLIHLVGSWAQFQEGGSDLMHPGLREPQNLINFQAVEWSLLCCDWHIHLVCCAVLCCAVLCCAVLCCAVLCCAVLCCAVQAGGAALQAGGTGQRAGVEWHPEGEPAV
jgi:hypothetical protein